VSLDLKHRPVDSPPTSGTRQSPGAIVPMTVNALELGLARDSSALAWPNHRSIASLQPAQSQKRSRTVKLGPTISVPLCLAVALRETSSFLGLCPLACSESAMALTTPRPSCTATPDLAATSRDTQSQPQLPTMPRESIPSDYTSPSSLAARKCSGKV